MTERNWERLLLATLEKVRGHLPGSPGYRFREDELNGMTSIEVSKARLGMDIDDIVRMSDERGYPTPYREVGD